MTVRKQWRRYKSWATVLAVKKKSTELERFSPKAQTGRSFDALMRTAIAVPPAKPKKASRPKAAKKKTK